MPTLIIKAAAAVLTTVGVPGGTVSVLAPLIGNAIWTAAVSTGLGLIAQGQVNDPETGKQSRRQPRPQRAVFMGAGSRGGPAYMGSDCT